MSTDSTALHSIRVDVSIAIGTGNSVQPTVTGGVPYAHGQPASDGISTAELDPSDLVQNASVVAVDDDCLAVT